MTDSTLFNRENEQTLFFVAIEWDGEQPPTTWYERMHALAGRVRGDKSQSPIVRRDDDSGVIFQEGLIFTPSESLARSLAFLARDQFDAAAVAIGESVVKTDFTMSRADAAVIERIASTLGRRGRKPADRDWVVTCLEEIKTFNVKHSQPIQCPNCRGMKIRIRPGTTVRFKHEPADIFDLWVRTRFSGPHWEPVNVELFVDDDDLIPPSAPPALADIEMGNSNDVEFVTALRQSKIDDQIRERPISEQLDILDSIYVSRRFTNDAKRGTNRINAIAKYFQYGGTRSDFAMAETVTPDLLDTATTFGDEYAATLWRGVMDNGDES